MIPLGLFISHHEGLWRASIRSIHYHVVRVRSSSQLVPGGLISLLVIRTEGKSWVRFDNRFVFFIDLRSAEARNIDSIVILLR